MTDRSSSSKKMGLTITMQWAMVLLLYSQSMAADAWIRMNVCHEPYICVSLSGTCKEDGKHAEGGCGQTSNNTIGIWRSNTLASGTWELLHYFRPSSSGWPKCTYAWAREGSINPKQYLPNQASQLYLSTHSRQVDFQFEIERRVTSATMLIHAHGPMSIISKHFHP